MPDVEKPDAALIGGNRGMRVPPLGELFRSDRVDGGAGRPKVCAAVNGNAGKLGCKFERQIGVSSVREFGFVGKWGNLVRTYFEIENALFAG